MKRKVRFLLNLVVAFSMVFALAAVQTASQAAEAVDSSSSIVQASSEASSDRAILVDNGGEGDEAIKTSHRLIVQLESPSLAEWSRANGVAFTGGRLQPDAPDAQNYINQLEAEQAAFISAMTAALPSASVGTYINEMGASLELTYQVVFNGVTVDPGLTSKEEARKILADLPGVKAVYFDFAHEPELYASLPLINAQAAWNDAAIGGQENAGEGVKVASMDGGLHHEAPMFDGTGFDFPLDYPEGGLGHTENNNGKIIASRVYFRAWDPPSAGDENPWPGTQGTSHGTHTGSTAAGNPVLADYAGVTETISGVAPQAWVMSYRVFYNSVTDDGAFYTAEGIAALEDILMDGADVLNNSWGGGPGSIGGEFDPLDTALINVANAGTFVSMSAGNAGPGNGTTDHPSDEYINVAASTTTGTLASGRLDITAPEPVPGDLKDIPYASSTFGGSIPVGTLITYDYLPAIAVDPSNFEGCDAWPAGTFTGKAALISRGSCEFGVKVLNAEQAGADFAIVYNHASGGEQLVSMAPGAVGNMATIPSVFVGHTNGLAMVDWYNTNGASSQVTVDTFAFQAGNTPDILASFSSRGPGVGDVLKPDITAPGVNILAQGYAPGTTGEARHLGYGQVSGTSMAAPHVAGAAALIRQIHPDWTNADIKSALMSTSKYIDIWNHDGTHAQPLDMGAGRLDLTNATDPGVILSPPSLSFGVVPTGTVETMNVSVTSVADMAETYTFETQLIQGSNFTDTTISDLPGFTVDPISVTLGVGETTTISVTFDSSQGSIGDNQGYILLDGDAYDAHMPAWARVTPPPAETDVLIIDNDASYTLGFPDYVSYYTDTLDNLGITYDVWDADTYFANDATIPEAAVLSSYDAVLYFSGDNFYPDGTFTVQTPLTQIDMDRLTQYANQGGVLMAMGQDMASVLNSAEFDGGTFFYTNVLGGNYLQDSVSGFSLPSAPIVNRSDAPDGFKDISLDLSGPESTMVALTGANEVPPVATGTQGSALLSYNAGSQALNYNVTVTVSDTQTILASHIHNGTSDVNGPVLYPLWITPTLVTDTFSFSGSVVISDTYVDELLNDGLYINVHSDDNPSGEVRGQIAVGAPHDGAANQYYIDEIATLPVSTHDYLPGVKYPYTALLKYPDAPVMEDGTVAMAHRDQPSLERPGISYFGRSIYTSFGLEGVNNGLGGTTREELLEKFFNWALDEPTAMISNTTPSNASDLTILEASLTSNIAGTEGSSYRWDFGDGSAYAGPFTANVASHTYGTCGTFTVRVEVTDSWGNVAIGEQDVVVSECTNYLNWLPLISR